jgi:hypothetical protein
MGRWAERISDERTVGQLTKPTKPGSVGFVSAVPTPFQEITPAETDQQPDLHGFTRYELLALADPAERAALEADPEVLEAFAFALRLTEIRERGERPAHYTRAAYCEFCGPVWLFPGETTRVHGCPWCEIVAKRRTIPRPLVRCADCAHWRRDSINPSGGLGSCTTEAQASKRPGSLWPHQGEITCGDWCPKSGEHP